VFTLLLIPISSREFPCLFPTTFIWTSYCNRLMTHARICHSPSHVKSCVFIFQCSKFYERNSTRNFPAGLLWVVLLNLFSEINLKHLVHPCFVIHDTVSTGKNPVVRANPVGHNAGMFPVVISLPDICYRSQFPPSH